MSIRSRTGDGKKHEEENATIVLVTVVGLPTAGVLVSPGERGAGSQGSRVDCKILLELALPRLQRRASNSFGAACVHGLGTNYVEFVWDRFCNIL